MRADAARAAVRGKIETALAATEATTTIRQVRKMDISLAGVKRKRDVARDRQRDVAARNR